MKNYNLNAVPQEIEKSQIDNLPDEAKKLFVILEELENFTNNLKTKLLAEFAENKKS